MCMVIFSLVTRTVRDCPKSPTAVLVIFTAHLLHHMNMSSGAHRAALRMGARKAGVPVPKIH